MKMYKILVFGGFIAYCRAASLPEDVQAKVIKYENINDGLGNYSFSFETSNGITREEFGHLENVGLPDQYMKVEGLYSYIDTNGERITVMYTADRSGYHVFEKKMEGPELVPYLRVAPNIVASLLGK